MKGFLKFIAFAVLCTALVVGAKLIADMLPTALSVFASRKNRVK